MRAIDACHIHKKKRGLELTAFRLSLLYFPFHCLFFFFFFLFFCLRRGTFGERRERASPKNLTEKRNQKKKKTHETNERSVYNNNNRLAEKERERVKEKKTAKMFHCTRGCVCICSYLRSQLRNAVFSTPAWPALHVCYSKRTTSTPVNMWPSEHS